MGQPVGAFSEVVVLKAVTLMPHELILLSDELTRAKLMRWRKLAPAILEQDP